jgi:hypothetical protein
MQRLNPALAGMRSLLSQRVSIDPIVGITFTICKGIRISYIPSQAGVVETTGADAVNTFPQLSVTIGTVGATISAAHMQQLNLHWLAW